MSDTAVDKQTVKDKLIPAYRYMVAYNYNVKKDKATAVTFNDKILVIDPADATALKTKDALNAPPVKQKIKTEDSKEKIKPGKTKVKNK